MSDINTRAAKLLDQLGAWFDADEVKPPPYVQHQMDELRECLDQRFPSGRKRNED